MNIFFLHHLPHVAASLHCDTHVVKMILETTQILSTVHHLHDSPLAPYKPTHINHPCVKWAAESRAQYLWLQTLGHHLCNQYRLRYGRDHACETLIKTTLANPPETMSKRFKWSEPPKCMPEQYRSGTTVEAYRRYYREEKSGIAKWRNGVVPSFMTSNQERNLACHTN